MIITAYDVQIFINARYKRTCTVFIFCEPHYIETMTDYGEGIRKQLLSYISCRHRATLAFIWMCLSVHLITKSQFSSRLILESVQLKNKQKNKQTNKQKIHRNSNFANVIQTKFYFFYPDQISTCLGPDTYLEVLSCYGHCVKI